MTSGPTWRLLRMLSLLQRRPSWPGAELAEALGVTTRTIRRDVDRLRELGYPVDAAPGPDGGYRLGVGGAMPPLLLDEEEAAAVAIALRTMATGPVGAMEEAALSALSKLDRVLPPRERARVEALREVTLPLARHGDGGVDPGVLVTAAQGCAAAERLRMVYRDRQERVTERRIEPFRLVPTTYRWYFVARDVEKAADDDGGWRTFRVDRIVSLETTGHRFDLTDPPDAASLVAQAVTAAPYRYTARVRLAMDAEQVRARVPPTAAQVEPDGDQAILVAGADDLDHLLGWLVMFGVDLEVLEPPELGARARAVGERLAASP